MSHKEDENSGNVSRRKFVKAAGATGVVGLAGCAGGSGDGGGDGGTTTTATPTKSGDGGGKGQTVVQFASDADLKGIQSKYNKWLHDAGMRSDVKVEVLAGSNVTNKRQNKYNQWLSAGRSKPSVLMMDSGWTIPFIASDQLLNLSNAAPDLAKMVNKEFFDMSVETAKSQKGNLYAVPIFPDFPTMQYRKDLLRDVGYSDSDFKKWATESMDWGTFSQITKKAKKEHDLKYGYTFQFDVYEGNSCCDFNEFLSSFGGAYFGKLENLFGPVGERPVTVDEQPVVDSLRMLRRFVYGDSGNHALTQLPSGQKLAGKIAPQAVLQWTEEPSRKPFTNGKAAMHRNWPYSININGAEKKFGKDLGVMPIPYMPPDNYPDSDSVPYKGTNKPGGPVAALGGWHYAINPNTNKKDAALDFIRAATNKNVQLNIFREIGWIPPRPTLLDSQRAGDVPVMGRYLEQLKIAGQNAVSRPVTVAWPTQSTKIAQESNAAVAKEKTPAKAMNDLKKGLKAIEQRFSA